MITTGDISLDAHRTKIRVKRFLGQLYGDPTIRLKLAEIVAPVQRPGVDSFEARVEGEPGERVTKDEANWFLPRAEESADERQEVVAETVVQILKPWLRSGEIRHKWKFIDARGPFSATMDDRDFLQRVESGDIKLGARDMFHVSLKTTMMTNPKTGRLRRQHAVVRVLGAESAPHQLVLPTPSK